MDNPNIYQRINAVMKDVEYVKKDARVQGYRAVTHDQVTSAIRRSLVEHGIVIRLEQTHSEIAEKRDLERGIKMHLYSGTYNVNFVNIDSPQDVATVCISAHAADNGDKAPGKCASYATKYAMLKMFSLETGEDDESRAEAKNTITEEKAKELESMIDGNTTLLTAIRNAYQVESIEQIPAKKFDEVKTRINNFKERQNGNN